MYAELGESRNNKSMANYSMLQLSFDSTYSLPECSVESFCDVDNITDRVQHSNLRNGNNNNDSSDDENHEFIDDNIKEEYDYGNNIANSNNFEQSNSKYSNSIQDKMYGFDNISIDNIDDYKVMYEEANQDKVQTNQNQQLEPQGHREEEKQKQHQERVQQWLQQIQRRLSLSSKASNHPRSHQSESYEEKEIESAYDAENSNNFNYNIPEKNIKTNNNNSNNSSKETYSPNQNDHVSTSLESITLMPTYTKASQKKAVPQIREHEEEEYGEEQLWENHGRYTKRQSISTSYALQSSKTPKLTPLESFYLLEYDEIPNNKVNGTLHKEVSTNIDNSNDRKKCESHIKSNKLLLPLECAVDENVSRHHITENNCDKANFSKQEESHNNTDLILPPVRHNRHHNEQQPHHHNNSYKSVIYNNTEQQQAAQQRLIRQCKLPMQTPESKEYSPLLTFHNHPLHSKVKQVSAGQSSMPSTMDKATFTPLTPFSYLTPSWQIDTNEQNMYEESIEDDVTGQNNIASSTNTNAKKSKERCNTDSCWGNGRQNNKENSNNSRNKKGNTNCNNYKYNISKTESNDKYKDINANTTALYLASELLDKGKILLEQNQNKTDKVHDVTNMQKTNSTRTFSRKDVQSNYSPYSRSKENKHNNDRSHEMPDKMRSNSSVEADHTDNNNDKLLIVSKQIKQPTNCQTSTHDVTTNNIEHTDVVISPVSATNHVPYSLAKYNKIQLPTLTSHEPTSYSYYDNNVDNDNKNSNETNSDNNREFVNRSNTDGKVSTADMQYEKNNKSLNVSNNNKFGSNELENVVDNNQRQLKWKYLQEVVALNDNNDNNNVTSTETGHPKSHHENKNINKSELLGTDNVEKHNSSEHNTSHIIHSDEQQSVRSTNIGGLSVGNSNKPRSNSLDTGLMHQGKHGILLKRFSYLSQSLPEQHNSNEDITNNKNKHKNSLPFGRATWMNNTTPPALNVSNDEENEFSTSLEEKIAKHEIVVDEVELLRQQRNRNVEHGLDTNLDNKTKEHQHTKQSSQTQKEELNLSSQNIYNIYHNNDIADENGKSIYNKKCSDGSSKPASSKSNVTMREGQNKTHPELNTKHNSLTKAPCQESNNNTKTKRFVPITSIEPLSTSMLSNDQSLTSLSIPSFYRLSLHEHEIGNKNSNHNNNSNNNSNTKESVLEHTTDADGTQSKSDNANQNDDSTYSYKHDGNNTNNEIVDNSNGKSEVNTNVVIADKAHNDVTSEHDETHGRHSVSFAPDVIFFKH